MKRTLVAALALTMAMPVLAQQAGQAANPYLQNVPLSAGPMVLPISPSGRGTRPYEMSRIVSPEEKAQLMK